MVNQDECPPTTTTPKAGLGAILDRLAASTAQPPPPPPLPPSGMYAHCSYSKKVVNENEGSENDTP